MYKQLINKSKLLGLTAVSQAVIQVTGLLSGVLVIRLLSVEEYAYYTIANTLLGTMTVLSDGGISTGVMAESGKVWTNKYKLGSVLATGMILRRRFAIFSSLLSLPILALLLFRQGATIPTIIAITLAIIPAFIASLTDALLQIPVKIHQQIKPLQINQLLVSILRLFLNGISLVLFPFTSVGLLANGISRIYGNLRLRKISDSIADRHMKPDMEVKKSIIKMVKKILPGAFYFCFSSQITIWLISLTGSSTSVGQLGAIGRISMVLSVVSSIFSTLIVPRFARLSDHRRTLAIYLTKITAGLFTSGCIFILFIYLFPKQILWILGKAYYGLEYELLLSMVGAFLSLMGGSIFSLYSSRGYIISPIIFIPLNITLIIINTFIFQISTLEGILMFNISLAGTQFIIHYVFGMYKIVNTDIHTT